MSSIVSPGLYGLALCGGTSSRMGSDKGLLTAGDKNNAQTWAAKAGETLKQAGLLSGVFYSVNPEQVDRYRVAHKDKIDPSSYIVDSNEVDVAGPLRGILTAHKTHPTADWLVLAVDMINMRPETLTLLMTQYAKYGSAYDVYCYRTQGNPSRIQPLAAIYSGSFLKKIYAENIGQINDSHSQQRGPTWYIQHANAYYLELKQDVHESFHNANSVEDLDGI